MTNAELAVLGLIAEQPRHGYQIEQVIEQRGMRKWTDIGFSSIYFLLKKLERQGLIEGRLEKTERGPARRVYQAAPAGQRAFHTAVVEALSVPQHIHRSLLLGLANLPAISRAEAMDAIGQYRRCLASRVQVLESLRDTAPAHPYFVQGILDYDLTVMQAELEWAERFIERLKTQSKAEREQAT